MINVCFVCHANCCRSPLAEFVLKDYVNKLGMSDSFHIISRATAPVALGHDIVPPMAEIMDQNNIPHFRRESTMITEEEVDSSTYLIYMDTLNLMNLKKLFPDKEINNAYKLSDFSINKEDIEDPWFTGRYEYVFKQILKCIKSFMNDLVEKGLV